MSERLVNHIDMEHHDCGQGLRITVCLNRWELENMRAHPILFRLFEWPRERFLREVRDRICGEVLEHLRELDTK